LESQSTEELIEAIINLREKHLYITIPNFAHNLPTSEVVENEITTPIENAILRIFLKPGMRIGATHTEIEDFMNQRYNFHQKSEILYGIKTLVTKGLLIDYQGVYKEFSCSCLLFSKFSLFF